MAIRREIPLSLTALNLALKALSSGPLPAFLFSPLTHRLIIKQVMMT